MKTLKPKPPSEAVITKQIRSYLALRGIFHWKNWGGPMSEKGVADILGIFEGRPLAIEVKSARGKLSEYQARWLSRHRAAGGVTILARSVEDVRNVLEGSGEPYEYQGPVGSHGVNQIVYP